MAANFEYYKIFYYVAKYQNFTLAAKALLSSQPSVSRCMQALETELGCRLFVRTKRGVSLTAEGEQLYKYVAPACEQIFKGEENIGGTLGYQNGSVYIGVTETALHCFLLKKLSSFHRQYPGVRLKLTSGTTPNTLADLKAGKTDLAVVTTPIREDPHFRVTLVKECQDILAGGSNYSYLKGKKVPLSEVRQNASGRTRRLFFRKSVIQKMQGFSRQFCWGINPGYRKNCANGFRIMGLHIFWQSAGFMSL